MLRDVPKTSTGQAAGDSDRDPRCRRLELAQHLVGRVQQVGFGDHDDGHRTALPGDGEVALDPPHVDVGGRRDDERHVDIGRQHLLPGLSARALAREDRAPVDDALDCVALERDPVADSRVDAPCDRAAS
jgi:hypothetical protein